MPLIIDDWPASGAPEDWPHGLPSMVWVAWCAAHDGMTVSPLSVWMDLTTQFPTARITAPGDGCLYVWTPGPTHPIFLFRVRWA